MRILHDASEHKALRLLRDFCHYHEIKAEFVDQASVPAPSVVEPIVFDPPVVLERGKTYAVRSKIEFCLPATVDRLREDLNAAAQRAGVEFVLVGPGLEIFSRPPAADTPASTPAEPGAVSDAPEGEPPAEDA